MADTFDLEHRAMPDVSINKSFRGILRIAHIKDIVNDVYDEMFRPEYYGTPSKLSDRITSMNTSSAKANGSDTAYPALSGSTRRYTSDNHYINCKVPVTDSLGNSLNMRVGFDGTVFGFNEDNNGIIIDEQTFLGINGEFTSKKIYPILETETLYVGHGESVDSSEEGKISIDPTYNGKFAGILEIPNIFDHCEGDIEQKGNDGYFKKVTDKNLRTIYSFNENDFNDRYDAFVYSQESYDEDNFLKTTENRQPIQGVKTQIDAKIKCTNLKDIIKERVNKVLNSSIIEVPTGTVLYHYTSYEKWYGSDKGNRPCMEYTLGANNNASKDKQLYINTLFPSMTFNASKDTNFVLTSKDFNSDDIVTDEVIPLHKRDYVLTNGQYLPIGLTLTSQRKNFYSQTFDRFFNLFLAIGYYYTDKKNIANHYAYKKVKLTNPDNPDDFEEVYCYLVDEYDEEKIAQFKAGNIIDETIADGEEFVARYANAMRADQNKFLPNSIVNFENLKNYNDICYSIDATTIIVFNLIKEYLNIIDRKNEEFNWFKAVRWLKEQKFPDEYIIQGYSPLEYSHVEDIMTYYDDSTRRVNLGREINSCKSLCAFYKNNGEYTETEVYKLPSINFILFILHDLFRTAVSEILRSKGIYIYQVPNTNLDFKIEDTNYSFGGFLGSSAGELDSESSSSVESYCPASLFNFPHRHALYIGGVYDETNGGVNMFRGENQQLNCANNSTNISNKSIVLADFSHKNEGDVLAVSNGGDPCCRAQVKDPIWSYLVGEIGGQPNSRFSQSKNEGLTKYFTVNVNNIPCEVIGYINNGKNICSNTYKSFPGINGSKNIVPRIIYETKTVRYKWHRKKKVTVPVTIYTPDSNGFKPDDDDERFVAYDITGKPFIILEPNRGPTSMLHSTLVEYNNDNLKSESAKNEAFVDSSSGLIQANTTNGVEYFTPESKALLSIIKL